MNSYIGFNKPYLTGKETQYLHESVLSGKISGNGIFTKKCHEFFQNRYHFKKCLLTTSCTDALEMAAILLDIVPGDEVIIPSYTFVSTANAFVLRGAKIVFADCLKDHPNVDPDKLENLITKKTKAIVVVHYAGIACDMNKILLLTQRHNLFLVEDAAQAIDSLYYNRSLGSIGHLATFSFHETKNITSGEGGMLVINDERFFDRSEIIWEKGTNRSAFFKGEVDKYGWVDIGSSFLPSEILAAFLWAQIEHLDEIQKRRKEIWNTYFEGFREIEKQKKVKLPVLPVYATNNAHMFYLVCKSEDERVLLIEHLKEKKINAVFHYLSLHKSPFYTSRHDGREMINSDFFSQTLVRLPFFYELSYEDQKRIIEEVNYFFNHDS